MAPEPRTTPGIGGWRRRLLVEPARPDAIRGRADAHWLVVAAVCAGAFMGQLDASIVTLALPTLKSDFGASLGAVQWVALSYLLVLVCSVAAVGRLSDMVGRKLIYTYGFVVFGAGSALCGLAPTLLALSAFRGLQALGAAMLQANSVAIIRLAVPQRVLGRAIGIQGAAQAPGLSLGPVLGGVLIGLGGWRLIFFVNVPIGMAGAFCAWLLVPRSRNLQPRTRFDWLGLGLLTPALAALLIALSFGNERGWTSPEIVTLLVVAFVSAIAFVVREMHVAHALIDLRLFAYIAFSAGIASGLLSYLVLFGALFTIPFYLEGVRGLSPSQTGLLLVVLPIALVVVAPIAGRLADRIGSRILTVVGMLLAAGGLGLLALEPSWSSLFAVELAIVGVGIGAFTPPNNASIMNAAPREQSASAGGIINLTRGLGTSLGLTLTALVFGLVAGGHVDPASAADGYTASMTFLAAVALAAAGLAALRGASGTALNRAA